MQVLLNGVGRIGKSILRIASFQDTFSITAVNELNSNIENIAYSINYDSTYGRFEDRFEVNGRSIKNTRQTIKILNESSLLDIDLKKLNIDIIIDASGAKVDIQELKKLPVKAVFLTHPNNKADINIILGVNEHLLKNGNHKLISTSSCNATALLPVLKIIDENMGIEYGDVTTIHPLLNHQKTLDSSCVGSNDRNIECNFEFGRSSLQNIIPSQTTTITACSYIMDTINDEKFSSNSFRVPTSTVGAIDLTLFLKNETSKNKIIDILKEYERTQKYKILLNNEEQLVSSDFQAQEYTSIIDHRFTDLKMKKMLKLIIWYDNEWGYASKVVDMVKLIK